MGDRIPDMYDSSYYDAFRAGSRRSAQVIVPLIVDWVAPASVIDLGCGMGEWLSVFEKAGVREVRGVDGHHIPHQQIAIPADRFTTHDLTTPYSAGRRYDLAICLEVAEHLPPESGACLVRSLVDLAPVVLFSAAIPNQPGEHHVNCQWPAYWADLFAEHGHLVIDTLRFELWNDSRIDWWYRQNIMIYACGEQLGRWPRLAAMHDHRLSKPLSLVHPEMFHEVYKDVIQWGVDWEKRYWDLWKRECGRAAGQ
jgi:SAM-dependent methyltransferase